MEDDPGKRCLKSIDPNISTHVLRMEDDQKKAGMQKKHRAFQPTSSAWRTTAAPNLNRRKKYYFNPRPPHGGRQNYLYVQSLPPKFQPTSSAWRTTLGETIQRLQIYYFNPRPPHGGRPKKGGHAKKAPCISTHVLRMEDDWMT